MIFFLTDADEPRLSGGQLYEIRRRAAGIQINAIEFGIGPKSGGDSFLARLAPKKAAIRVPRYHEIRPSISGNGES